MKNTLLKTAVVVTLGLFAQSCEKASIGPIITTTNPVYTASMNGSETIFHATSTVNSNYLTITATSPNYTLVLYIHTPISESKDSLGASTGSYATVQNSTESWETNGYSAMGILTITAYNPSSDLISGTFSFNAASSSDGSAFKVTNGLFSNIFIGKGLN
jgi:hypothetical protein